MRQYAVLLIWRFLVRGSVVRDVRFDVVFDDVPIGRLVARNRFDQVPHGNGMTSMDRR